MSFKTSENEDNTMGHRFLLMGCSNGVLGQRLRELDSHARIDALVFKHIPTCWPAANPLEK